MASQPSKITEKNVIKRLTDRSAFVVFERNTHKTIVIQMSSVPELLMQYQIETSAESFQALREEEQLALIASVDLSEYFN